MGLKDFKNRHEQMPQSSPEVSKSVPQEMVGGMALITEVEAIIVPQTREDVRRHNERADRLIAEGKRLRPHELKMSWQEDPQ